MFPCIEWTNNSECGRKSTLNISRSWPALASVLTGAFIYIVYGADTLLVNTVLRTMHFGGLVDSVRDVMPESYGPIRNQVPDGLWVFAGTNVLFNIWDGTSSAGRYWVFIPLLLGFIGELGQLIHQVPGTFDSLDIFSMVIGYILAYGVAKKRSFA